MTSSSKTFNLQPPVPTGDKAENRDEMGKPVTQRRSAVRLGREEQVRIGQQLRAMYDDFVSQGVPVQIADLVRRLSEQDDGAV
jgi:hypothetical protein